MRRTIGLMFIMAVILTAGIWWITAPQPIPAVGAAAQFDEPGNPEHGRLVFAAGDCASCHASPGQADGLRLGGGIALASPFGTFRAPNISPDPQDRIGIWRASDLANALLRGVSPDGSHYYPVFPVSKLRPYERN